MWTASYVLAWTKKAMEITFWSCAHWAWRILSRQLAKKEYNIEKKIESLKQKWITLNFLIEQWFEFDNSFKISVRR